MAKSKHHHYVDTIDQVASDAIKKGIIHLYATTTDGRILQINGRELINFGSCSYLGLETHNKLKEGAVSATQEYGVQFPSSRIYVSSEQYAELEDLFSLIYKCPIIITQTTSLAHIAAIPILVGDEDAIILDHHAHASMQNAVQLVKPRGVSVDMIRHNQLNILEEKIKALSQKHKKIWYLADGVYSMHGDFAPVNELITLLNKYEQFNLYVDDAHGMSWSGEHGKGYTLGQVDIHERMVVTTSLAKGFGVAGALLIFKDYEWKRKIRTCGSTLIFSGPIQPPLLGALIASAKIHLSQEIDELQKQLNERVTLTNTLLKQYELPAAAYTNSPIFFVEVGLPKVGYNIVKRLFNDKFYVSIAAFPATPINRAGLRFTNTLHHTLADIEEFIKALAYHLPRAIEEERRLENGRLKPAMLPLIIEAKDKILSYENYTVQYERTIKSMDKEEWNSLFGNKGIYDWNGLLFLEEVFSNNAKPEDNWDFHYYIIRDRQKRIILATFFTCTLCKDDMLSPPAASKIIEEKRKTDPYYLVSKCFIMGTLTSEGEHMYIDRNFTDWKYAFRILLEEISKEQEKNSFGITLLRDFKASDLELCEFLLEQGYLKIDIPNSNIIENISWNSFDEFLKSLSYKNRQHFRKDIVKYQDMFEVEIKNELSEEELKLAYKLYLNVKTRNLDINTFEYPERMLYAMNTHPSWEFIILKLKPEPGTTEQATTVGIVWCYKAETHYSPMVIGMDYNFVFSHKVYKQALYQMLLRAQKLGLKKLFLGLSADVVKRKLGAKQISCVAYVQAKDNFNMEVIETMSQSA